MAREIKFRAWDGKMMFYGYVVHCNYAENAPIKVMQYTGLKDKNGKEIYEGDLIRAYFSFGEYFTEAIYESRISPLDGLHLYYRALYGEEVRDGKYNQYPASTDLCAVYGTLKEDYVNQNYDRLAYRNTNYGDCYSNDFEVIGNIYENGDLLNEQKP